MSDITEEGGDILEEAEEVADKITVDLEDATGIEFTASVQGIDNSEHHKRIRFGLQPDGDGAKDALQEVDAEYYDNADLEIQGGFNLYLNL
jgi:hypothetical protein